MLEISQYRIKGAEIKLERDGHLIVGFSSQVIVNEQLISLREIKENFFLAFYNCDLSKCDLKLLFQTFITHVGIFHASFGDADLIKLCESNNLLLVKLHDTLVTQTCINEIKEKKPHLQIFN